MIEANGLRVGQPASSAFSEVALLSLMALRPSVCETLRLLDVVHGLRAGGDSGADSLLLAFLSLETFRVTWFWALPSLLVALFFCMARLFDLWTLSRTCVVPAVVLH